MRRCDSYYSVMLGVPLDALRRAGMTWSTRSSSASECERRGTRSARRDEMIQGQFKRFSEWEVDWDNAVQARTSRVRGWEKLLVRAR